MKTKNKIIIILIAIALLLFLTIWFWIVPANDRKLAKYELRQQDAISHDITVIKDNKTAYVGDATNVSHIYEKLPLGNVGKKYEIDSQNCTLTVNYLDTTWNIGEEKVRQDLVYNTIAVMASIDNLSVVTYKFSGDSFSFTREQVKEVFGEDLGELLDEETWKEKVQNKISDADFLKQFY